MTTAAVVIIGDEILSGKFADENGPYLIKRLRELGCDLVRIAVVRDTLDDISAEVAKCAAKADHVITTGGVGPTHDDVTLEGIAQAFGVELEVHSRVVELMESWGMAVDDTTRRMARLPAGAELIEGGKARFPVVRVRNVIILPGVPRLMRLKFEDIAERVRGVPVLTARVSTLRHESAIASVLTATQQRYPSVAIGSYPRYEEDPFRVIVTLESRDAQAMAEALAMLHTGLPDVVDG
ncbi:MAG: molybdenum cofactor synthesis domain-containing protein [Myxococcota bacterium]|jgi:molybdenum cofactor synthesis domain-containing protein